jgi:hypothetical protein
VALQSSRDYQGGPVWALFRTGALRRRFHVAWADLARELSAVILPDGVVPLNTCYYIGVSERRTARALQAWLSSTWIRALARLQADTARGGYRRFNARAIRMLPLLTESVSGNVLEVADQGTADDVVAAALDLRPAHRAALLHVLADTAHPG